MHIAFKVSGYLDWEPAETLGVTVTASDVKKLRAKPSANGGYLVRVEKRASGDRDHGVNVPEAAVCMAIATCAAGGKEVPTREDVISELIRDSNKHHIRASHVRGVEVHDAGPDAMLMAQCIAGTREQMARGRVLEQEAERLGLLDKRDRGDANQLSPAQVASALDLEHPDRAAALDAARAEVAEETRVAMDEAMAGYLEPVDLADSLTRQFGPRRAKETK
jgi:hypothetical protein